MARKYSEIFSLIVRDQSDLIGHIAYGLYKDEKAKYIGHFKETNGREPSDAELDLFHDISCQKDKIIKYRFIASNILRSFIDESLIETIEQAEQDCVERHADVLREVIKPLQPATKKEVFLHGVLQSIAGAFAFSLIVAAFMFIKEYKGADSPITTSVEKYFHKIESPKPVQWSLTSDIDSVVSVSSIETNQQ